MWETKILPTLIQVVLKESTVGRQRYTHFIDLETEMLKD